MSNTNKQLMTKGEYTRRYILFFISVVINGCGIGCITMAHIGTTPISSSNYVFALHSNFTLGDTTMIFNVLLVVLQLLCIGYRNLRLHMVPLLMQIPVIIIFSAAIDIVMQALQLVLPESMPYICAWLLVIGGTIALAFGVSVAFTANVAMVPGEYFIKVFHPLVKKSFSFVKTFFDIFLVSAAVVISLIYTGFTDIEGVREGTLFAALTTGPMVHFFIPRIAFLNKFLVGKQKANA